MSRREQISRRAAGLGLTPTSAATQVATLTDLMSGAEARRIVTEHTGAAVHGDVWLALAELLLQVHLDPNSDDSHPVYAAIRQAG